MMKSQFLNKKNHIDLLMVIVLLLLVQTAFAQQPASQSCKQKLISSQKQSLAENDAVRGNNLEQLKVAYRANMRQKELFEGECASDPNARGFVQSASETMLQLGATCKSIGGSQDCGAGQSSNTVAQTPSLPTAPQARSVDQGPVASNSDRPIARKGAVSAVECISIETDKQQQLSLRNGCGSVVTVLWCVEGHDCRGSKFYSNRWNINAGKTYPISMGNGTRVSYAACWGSNQAVESSSDGAFSCP